MHLAVVNVSPASPSVFFAVDRSRTISIPHDFFVTLPRIAANMNVQVN
jgi:hypothetical protein